ncbi:transcription elongation factor [Saccharomonospora marina XMU15]|uniref:Transcription elongation factor n=1 Tax=Saccharomonospora marina XMU15 TaxID=882083 RepID=H5X8D9_9PSEU|nr:transcription elongation factor [Saccharomonospora marina XMU15]
MNTETTRKTVNEHSRCWLTKDAFDRLSEELSLLRSRTARGPDFADADPDELVHEHRRQRRIRELEELLRRVVVDEAPPDDGIAEPGMVLTVRFDDDPETETFLLGLPDGVEDGELEVCSPDSPLGAALLDARQGEQRRYVVPSGDAVRVTLLRAVPFGQHRPAT